ncbi:hypothetical protein NDU88_006553 [Pleurodeles waltl]|uniref:Uncharacterized protein n=1 Tax=Pleurodeles waltl TaxID=8319 RepID=A0AAV7VRA9_PLEWA|nr:hypothetical protein NDU88_006553 [Pleurodeles waltl]
MRGVARLGPALVAGGSGVWRALRPRPAGTRWSSGEPRRSSPVDSEVEELEVAQWASDASCWPGRSEVALFQLELSRGVEGPRVEPRSEGSTAAGRGVRPGE